MVVLEAKLVGQLLMSILKKIRQVGLAYSIAIIFQRIVPEWLFRTRYYVVLRLDTNYQPVARETPVRVQIEYNDEEIQAVEDLTYFNRSMNVGTFTAMSAKIDDQLVGGFWAAQNAFDESELGVRVKLGAKQCWLFAAYVDKSARGLGIYPQLIKGISNEMVEMGVVDQLVAVNPFNKSSYKVLKRFAGDPIARVFAIRFLNKVVCFKNGHVKGKKAFSLDRVKSPVEIEFEKQPELGENAIKRPVEQFAMRNLPVRQT